MADEPAVNTDREIWRLSDGDSYIDRIFVTEGGGIGIDCGGHVIVKPVREWHRLADQPAQATGEPVAWRWRNRYPSRPDMDATVVARNEWHFDLERPSWASIALREGSAEFEPLYLAASPAAPEENDQ